jgi:hypothetical protein
MCHHEQRLSLLQLLLQSMLRAPVALLLAGLLISSISASALSFFTGAIYLFYGRPSLGSLFIASGIVMHFIARLLLKKLHDGKPPHPLDV